MILLSLKLFFLELCALGFVLSPAISLPPIRVKLLCYINAMAEYFTNGFFIVTSEVGDGIMISVRSARYAADNSTTMTIYSSLLLMQN